MTMQLLTPNEAQKRSRNDTVLDAARKKELSDAVNEKRIELAHLEEAGAKFLASQRARWAIEEQEHIEWSAQKKIEVESLEEKYKKALFPIEELRRNAENKMSEAEIALANAERISIENEEIAEVLGQRLDGLSEREYETKKREAELDRREEGIEAQEIYTSKRAVEISSIAQTLFEKAQALEQQLNERQQSIETREEATKSVSLKQTARDRELDYREANLISRYQALEEATRMTINVKPNNIRTTRRK